MACREFAVNYCVCFVCQTVIEAVAAADDAGSDGLTAGYVCVTLLQ